MEDSELVRQRLHNRPGKPLERNSEPVPSCKYAGKYIGNYIGKYTGNSNCNRCQRHHRPRRTRCLRSEGL